jgi:hypothetical protein
LRIITWHSKKRQFKMMVPSTEAKVTSSMARDTVMASRSGLTVGNTKATGFTTKEKVEANSDTLRETSMMVRYSY